jgi:hypothetical protein
MLRARVSSEAKPKVRLNIDLDNSASAARAVQDRRRPDQDGATFDPVDYLQRVVVIFAARAIDALAILVSKFDRSTATPPSEPAKR